MAKILVVDDEPQIRSLVSAYLKSEGLEIYTASDGPTALKISKDLKPDLIILDIMLPGMDGLDILTRLRHESNVYVILLTAKTEETDKIIGLSVGADDYMTKPFSPRELTARVKAALRRMNQAEGHATADKEFMNFKHVALNLIAHTVSVDGNIIELTAIEYELLKTLAMNRGRVLGREQLLQSVWGYNHFEDTRVVDVHIGHVRKKIGRELISTIRSIGYRFEDEAI